LKCQRVIAGDGKLSTIACNVNIHRFGKTEICNHIIICNLNCRDFFGRNDDLDSKKKKKKKKYPSGRILS
jgi:hypothetical protein